MESSEDTAEAPDDKSVAEDNERQVSKLNLEPSASSIGTGPPMTTKFAEQADTSPTESARDVTVPAEDQSKGQSSPTITSPRAKPRHPSADSAEIAVVKGAKDDYIVSIPLSLVRLSRKSKSRSSSKDLGGKLARIIVTHKGMHVHVHVQYHNMHIHVNYMYIIRMYMYISLACILA